MAGIKLDCVKFEIILLRGPQNYCLIREIKDGSGTGKHLYGKLEEPLHHTEEGAAAGTLQ